MFSSLTLKDFLLTIEGKACKKNAQELLFVDQFIELIQAEKLIAK
jgi:hypothetical protein